jgi:hypothetical protein
MRRKTKSWEKGENNILIDLLRTPVGSNLGPSENIDTSLYDTIFLGSRPSTLYMAALKSRWSRKYSFGLPRRMPVVATFLMERASATKYDVSLLTRGILRRSI